MKEPEYKEICESCEKFTCCVYHNSPYYCPKVNEQPKPPKLKKGQKSVVGWLFTND
jgi:hypothetical protein